MARKRKNDPPPTLPTVERRSENGRLALELRCAMTPATRLVYAETATSPVRASQTREDAWYRAVEFLFERLAVAWTIDGVATTGQKALLERFRVADPDQRRWVRSVLRDHLSEWFPEMQAP